MFSAEVELAKPVEQWLRRQGSSCVAHEVVSDYGIPDLVAGVGAPELLKRRRRQSLPITDPSQLAFIEFCQIRRTEQEVRDWAPRRYASFASRTLEPLLNLGILHENSTGVRSRKNILDPFDSLIAVELKLTASKRGFAQALSYRLFAEKSYFAVPATKISKLSEQRARELGLGLLGVTEFGCEVVVPPSEESIATKTRRRVTSERLIEASRDRTGRRAGSPLRSAENF